MRARVRSRRRRRMPAATTSSYATTVLVDAPVSYWKLDESAGTTAADSGSGNHPGTYGAGVTLAATTIQGNAPSFPGGTTGYVSVAHNADQAPAGAFTIEMWTKRTAAIAGNPRLFEKINQAVRIYVTATTIYAGFNANSGFREVSWAHSGLLVDGVKHHIVMRWDGTILTLWVDGVSRATLTPAASTPSLGGLTTYIGGNGSGTATDYWTNYIDDVAWYNASLSDARIAAHYAAG